MAKDFNARVTVALGKLSDGNTISGDLTGKLIKSIGSRGRILDVDMHTAAVAALTLSSLHRDANMAKLLLNAMPKGSRAQTLALWFETFGNLIVTAPAKGKGFKVKMKAEADCVPVDLAAAQAKPFWIKPETVSGAFDDLAFANAVAKLIKRATSDKAELSPASSTALADLKALSHKLPVVEAANA